MELTRQYSTQPANTGIYGKKTSGTLCLESTQMKPVSNTTLLIAVVAVGLLVIGVMFYTRETIQLTTSEDGKVLTGSTKRHFRLNSK